MIARCLFCGGDASEPDHLYRCDGRQGAREAALERWPQFTPAPLLNDAARGEELREQGIARVDAAAAEEFRARALEAVHRTALQNREVTSDDIWPLLGDVRTTDNRALGPVMRRAQRLHWIAPTDRVGLTAMPLSHRSPMRIWRSLIYAEASE